jgi:hypothetical protein
MIKVSIPDDIPVDRVFNLNSPDTKCWDLDLCGTKYIYHPVEPLGLGEFRCVNMAESVIVKKIFKNVVVINNTNGIIYLKDYSKNIITLNPREYYEDPNFIY